MGQGSRLEAFGLVFLRTVIGWHFLYEGFYKLMLPGWSRAGTPLTHWSAAGYLNASTGPFAGLAHTLASPGLIGWLEITPEADATGLRLAIVPHAFALREFSGRYTLDVRRQGAGGTSSSRQSGAFALAPGAPGELSHVAINLAATDRLEIELKLFVGNDEVFSVTAQSISRRI